MKFDLTLLFHFNIPSKTISGNETSRHLKAFNVFMDVGVIFLELVELTFPYPIHLDIFRLKITLFLLPLLIQLLEGQTVEDVPVIVTPLIT